MVDLAPIDIFSLAVYCTTFILGAPSNAVALCIFFKELKRKPTPNVIYMINLCISDGLFVAFLPVKMVETVWGEWVLPVVFCPIYHIFHFSTIYASVLFLMALSIGRYLSIAFPIRYKMYKSPRYSCVVCFVLWLLVVGHLAFIFLVEATGSQDHLVAPAESNASTCYANFTQNQLDLLLPLRLELAVVFFLAPLVLTSFAYLGCFWELSRSQLPQREKRKALRVAAITLTTFVACFAPYNASHLVGFALHENVNWRREALLPSVASAFLNPLVFFCSSSALQQSTTQYWQGTKQYTSSVKQSLLRIWHGAIPQEKGLNRDLTQTSDPVPCGTSSPGIGCE
ncbi:free fatty acid receptor 3-like [Carcharodon carcharias]|uniref:free fatty acid receptor 3-like n=1 Tax=Carcharodon carcharias TaxID=13397 RepID=UPI001B7DAF03|nr:free fatty acid receptor 3-like [Carcharodon carcharias]